MDTWKRISSGIYANSDGEVRFMLPQLLADCGIPATPANLQRAAVVIRDRLRVHNPAIPVVVTNDPAPAIPGSNE